MKGQINVTVRFKTRFWVEPYLSVLKMFCLLFGTEPDYQAVGNFIAKHGVKTEIL